MTWLERTLITYAQRRPRLQRVLCRLGVHARRVRPLGVTWDGALIAHCTACGRRFECAGF